jgi:hypothetical protein
MRPGGRDVGILNLEHAGELQLRSKGEVEGQTSPGAKPAWQVERESRKIGVTEPQTAT